METSQTKIQYDYHGAAEQLSLSYPALKDLVYKGKGPVTVKIGRRTFFKHDDLVAWVDQHRTAVD
ncbi:MAG: helix-turn-helix transcriptional regulator [Kordiimonas sp.]